MLWPTRSHHEISGVAHTPIFHLKGLEKTNLISKWQIGGARFKRNLPEMLKSSCVLKRQQSKVALQEPSLSSQSQPQNLSSCPHTTLHWHYSLYFRERAGLVPNPCQYCNWMSHTIFVVSQCIWKLCVHYTIVYKVCNSIMSIKQCPHLNLWWPYC